MTREYQEGEYDFLDFEAKYDAAYEGPNRFAGFSGGGLWHCPVELSEDGSLSAKEIILSGVAFYESGMEDDRRTIRCHGRRSIYGKAIDFVSQPT